MNWGYISIVTIFFTFLLIVSQRIVVRHKKNFRGFIVFLGILLMIRYEFQFDTLVAYGIALFLGFLFWLLIGRYNQVNNEDVDGIKVYGLDD